MKASNVKWGGLVCRNERTEEFKCSKMTIK